MSSIKRIIHYVVDGTVYETLEDAETHLKRIEETNKLVYERFVNGDLRNHLVNVEEKFNVNDYGFWQIIDPTGNNLHFVEGTLENAIKTALKDEYFLDSVTYGTIVKIVFEKV